MCSRARSRISGPWVNAATWHGHYDRLRLHTVRWLSGLPGRPVPRKYGPWVARDHVIGYLERAHRPSAPQGPFLFWDPVAPSR